MTRLKNIYIDLHCDTVITDPPGLDLDRLEIELEGKRFNLNHKLKAYENLGDFVIQHVRRGHSVRSILCRFMYTNNAISASFVAPELAVAP